MKKITNLIVSLSVLLLFITACSTNESNSESLPTEENGREQQIKVVTSIFPMYEIVKDVAGDRAEVSLMVGANEDAHHYEPSAQAVASVNEADVFVYSSHVMEFWVDTLLDVVENEDIQLVELADGLDLEMDDAHDHDDHNHDDNGDDHEDHDDHDHDHGGLDPHFWLDLTAVNQQLPLIVEALSQADPEGRAYYEENADQFSKELLNLDEQYESALANAENRIFVVQHQAFGHLAHRYRLDQVSVGGLTTEVEASPRKLVEIIEFIKEQSVPVIYYQSGENSGVAETIANETNTKIAVLHDLENKPASLDNDGNLYLEAMRENLEQLQKSIN